LRVRVTATNGVGDSAPVESLPSTTAPLLLVVQQSLRRQGWVAIRGTAAGVGQRLSTTKGIWTNDPTSYAYLWQRCDNTGSNCADIANANTSHYTLVGADAGHRIRSEVRASNAVGPAASGYAPSAPTAVVLGHKPAVTSLPKLSGTAQ